MKLMTAVIKVRVVLLGVQQVILITGVSLLTLNIIVDVTMRYVVRKPLLGLSEVAVMTALWLYMVGAAWGAREKSHVYAGVMEGLLKNKPYALGVLKTLINVFILVISCYMTMLACRFVLWDISSGRQTEQFLISCAYLDSSLIVGFALIAVYSLTHIVTDVVHHGSNVMKGP